MFKRQGDLMWMLFSQGVVPQKRRVNSKFLLKCWDKLRTLVLCVDRITLKAWQRTSARAGTIVVNLSL